MTIIAAPIIGPERAYACSCATVPEMDKALISHSAVFAGEVTKIEQENKNKETISSADKVEVTFNVAKVWKGDLSKQTKVLTVESEATCGYTFADNMSYLVFAYEGEDGSLLTGLCNGNAPLSGAGEQMKQLDAIHQSYEPIAGKEGAVAEAAPRSAVTGAEQNENAPLWKSGWAIALVALVVLAGFVLWLARSRRRG